MATIVTRSGKGSPLTNTEVDANFTNLNTELGTKANTSSLAAVATSGAYADLTGKPTTVDASNVAITGGTITGTTMDSITNHVGADHIHYKVKATQILAKGDVVKVVGFNSGEDAFEVAKVSASTDIAVGVIYSALANGAFGAIINTGLLEGINTSAFAIGTTLYANTSGGFTSTKPTTGRYQALALVVRSHANQGTILIEATNPEPTSLSQFTNDSGFTTNVGTVTSVSGTGTVSGLTLTGSVTSTGSLTLGGTLSLTSGNVTTALGFTPYNATNPSGYITSSALSPYLTSATAASTYQPLDGDLTAIAALAGTTGIVRKTAANTYSLDTATYLTGITSGQVTTALGYTPYNATNPAGYITGITSGNVTTALGYTPYNATNPAGYTTNTGTVTSVGGTGTVSGLTLSGTVTGSGNLTLGGTLSLTSSNVTTALGYTPPQPNGTGASGTWGISITGSARSVGLSDPNIGAGAVWVLTSDRTLNFADGVGAQKVMSSGVSATNNVDVRAPIFYDSNNTAFFVDPNSTSVLSTVRAAGIQHSSGNSAILLDNNTWTQFCDVNGVIKLWIGGTADPNNYYNANIHYFRNNGSGNAMTIDSAGNAIATASHRAPIFYDNNDTSYSVDPNSVTRLNKLTAGERSLVGYSTISMAGLDANTWYPVTIPIPVARQTTLRIENGLNSNAPSWSTHPAGFSCYFEWTVNGSGWGVIEVSRRITDWRENFTNVQIVGGITQMTFSSQEVIWLRGGANYYFSADCDVTPTVRTTSYDAFGQVVAPRSTVFNDPWATVTGKMSNAEYRATTFRDINNPSYYVSPASGSNLAGQVQIVGGATMSGGWNRSLYLAATYPVIVMNSANAKISGIGVDYTEAQSGMVFWVNGNSADLTNGSATAALRINTGNFVSAAGEFRAPIFRDSDNTAYFIDPSSTSNLNVLNVQPNNTTSGGGINFNGAGNAFIRGTNVDNAVAGGSNLQLQSWFGIGFGPSISGQPVPIGENAAWIDCRNGDLTARRIITGLSDVRAPIFYDSNNTAYYVDPNGTSVLNTLQFGSNPTSGGGGGRIIPSTGSPYSLRQEFGSDNSGWRYGIAKNVSGSVTVLFYVQDNGDCVATGNVTAYSDIRIKTNIETIPSALDKLDQIRGVTYTRTDLDDKERRYAGVIAQEIEAVLPEAVGGDDDIKTVDYNATIALLIQAVKELRDEVEMLRT